MRQQCAIEAVKAMTLGNGLSVANDWGNDGRLASCRLYNTSAGTNLSWVGYSQDANDNLGSIRDLTDETKSVYYGHDANDGMSLVSQAVATVPNNETYAYSAGTNRLASLTTHDSSDERRTILRHCFGLGP